MDYGLGELQQYQRHGLNVCDENGQCDDDRFDCLDESCNNGNCVSSLIHVIIFKSKIALSYNKLLLL